MSRRVLIEISLRLLGAWLLLSLLGLCYGKTLITALIPFFEAMIRLFSPDLYSPFLKVVKQNHQDVIQLTMTMMGPFRVSPSVMLPGWKELNVESMLIYPVSTLVVLLSALFGWPVRNWRERLLLLSLGGVAALGILGLTTPFVLLGHLEIEFQKLALRAGDTRAEPLLLSWMIFLELGGNWLLTLIAAFACIAPLRYSASATGGSPR